MEVDQVEHALLEQQQEFKAMRVLEQLAEAKLKNFCYSSIRKVTCRLRDNHLLLEGTVPSYYLKQIAQSLLLHHLQGLVSIDHQLHVARTCFKPGK